jgi:thymidylate kinase
MLIIIEGIDKSGKSTLVEYLLKNLPGCFMLKNGFRPKDSSIPESEKIVDAYNTMLDSYEVDYQNKIMIFDRFLLSEWVYSIKRGHETLYKEELQNVNKRLKKLDNVLLIHCSTDKELIKKKFIEDKEDHTKVEEIEMILDRYDKFVDKINVKNKLTYDYNITTPEKVARYIKVKMLGLKE